MTTAVIGATGRVGSEIVRGVLARGDAVAAFVRDPDKARRAFGEPDRLHIRPTRLDDPRDLTEAFDGIRTVFIAMGSIGIEGVLQRIAINATAGIPSIEQVTRLSVLNTSANSLGMVIQIGGHGVVSHAGTALVRMLADRVGLTDELSGALTRGGFVPVHDRGRVLVDLAVAILVHSHGRKPPGWE